MTVHLYIKEHQITGLKYLGKTKQDPYVYRGSGKRWLNHIKVHGNFVTTTVVGTYATDDDLRRDSLRISQLHNIVDDPSWANLRVEDGSGGDTAKFIDYSKINHGKGLTYEERYGPEVGKRMRVVRQRKFTSDHKSKMSTAAKARIYQQITCCCGKICSSNNIKSHRLKCITVAIPPN